MRLQQSFCLSVTDRRSNKQLGEVDDSNAVEIYIYIHIWHLGTIMMLQWYQTWISGLISGGGLFLDIYVDQQKLVDEATRWGRFQEMAWGMGPRSTFPCEVSVPGNCQGMAQWAKVSLVAIQKMIKDEFQAENWMATTEASGSASGDSGSWRYNHSHQRSH